MALLKFIIIALTLLLKGGSGLDVDVFSHPGQDVTLPCKGPSSYGPQSCSRVSWLYNRDSSKTFREVGRENIESETGRGDRLSLTSDCSLVVRHITAEDVGLYTCRQNNDPFYDIIVYLNILTVHQVPAVSDQGRGGEVLLECTLFRYKSLTDCTSNGLSWVDESGMKLEEGVQKFSRRANCLSRLTVKLQSGSSRKFRCQSVNRKNEVEVEAEYTPGLTDPGPALTPVPEPELEPKPAPSPDVTFVIVGVLLGVLLLLVVSSAVLIKHKRGAKVTEGQQLTHDVQMQPAKPDVIGDVIDVDVDDVVSDEPESDLTYVTVSHIHHQEKKKKTEKEKEKVEEEVTYSAVRSGVRTVTDDDPSSLYSNVSRPK